jgi:hypothetical protein
MSVPIYNAAIECDVRCVEISQLYDLIISSNPALSCSLQSIIYVSFYNLISFCYLVDMIINKQQLDRRPISLPLYNQLAKINRMMFWFVVVVDIIR